MAAILSRPPQAPSRQRIGRRDSNHTPVDSLDHPEVERAAMVAVVDRGDGHFACACAVDGAPHFEIGGDLTHRVSAIHD